MISLWLAQFSDDGHLELFSLNGKSLHLFRVLLHIPNSCYHLWFL